MTNIVFTPKNASVLFKKSYTYDTLMIHLNIHLNTKKRLQCVLWTYYSREIMFRLRYRKREIVLLRQGSV